MRKPLYRSRRDTMIAGVAAGMADFFDLDPTLVRLAWVLLFFLGPGLPVYLLAALIVPAEPDDGRRTVPAGPDAGPSAEEAASEEGVPAGGGADSGGSRPDGTRTFGWILIGVGAVFLLQRYTWIRWDQLWPVILILLGVYLLVDRRRELR